MSQRPREIKKLKSELVLTKNEPSRLKLANSTKTINLSSRTATLNTLDKSLTPVVSQSSKSTFRVRTLKELNKRNKIEISAISGLANQTRFDKSTSRYFRDSVDSSVVRVKDLLAQSKENIKKVYLPQKSKQEEDQKTPRLYQSYSVKSLKNNNSLLTFRGDVTLNLLKKVQKKAIKDMAGQSQKELKIMKGTTKRN